MNSNYFRSVIKVAGESGSLSTAGNIIINALRQFGLFVYSEREFPSLIKGGRANVQINYSNQQIRSMSHNIPVGVALDREGVLDCLDTLSNGGVLIHGFDRWNKVIKDLVDRASSKNLRVIEIPAREIAAENGGGVIMVNTVLMGVLFQVLDLSFELLEGSLRKELSKKPALLEINVKCAKAGFEFEIKDGPDTITSNLIDGLKTNFEFTKNKLILDQDKKIETNRNLLFLDGNSAIALGSLTAGCRAYYAYPMSPATTVLIQLAKWADRSGMLIKQAEDEITAVQMALGSMYAGTRAFTTTSGGGFDLMTETISLAGIIETPLVVAISQRPGPGTGLPTWTAQGDLSLAIYSGHGEYGKCVIACSNPVSCYENIQLAFNIAEKYQIPVILLTEANIAMSSVIVDEQDLVKVEIERGLDNSNEKERYEITQSGVSPRWLPGTSDKIYYANGDEHWIDGSVIEEADKAEEMYTKRLQKNETLLMDLPEPIIFGTEKNADMSFVGWGSTKNTILDAMDILAESNPEIKVNYLHYNFIYPLKTEKLMEFLANNKNINLIEGNATGQLGELITTKTGHIFHQKMLKWNGRPFYVEEVVEKIKNYKKS
jgi:2-oxoglutarate/2-oxoacid ferredoxin oxidoreductase subunit alpha